MVWIQLIKVAYDVLGLFTFLTTGEVETRAWTVLKGAKAPQAAGESIRILKKHLFALK